MHLARQNGEVGARRERGNDGRWSTLVARLDHGRITLS